MKQNKQLVLEHLESEFKHFLENVEEIRDIAWMPQSYSLKKIKK